MATLSDAEVEAGLEQLDGWQERGGAIVKDFSCGDFVGSVAFIDKVVGPAEELGHHPDLAVSWDTVTVSLSTHSEGGITAADLELAAKLDAL